ncbi:hypothetical protein MKQ68_06020 [Chitinophaga horti]|uniref:AraC family transcriptional regulator n=1 Tax=Chitinophaga horti TaxID=2920382 RepID=A0ABY6J4V0_9BACT|nr:hypothetical protein [Chitinophaga horti]UYQ94647.1 hypothetical protein MKQ68_06020 [Chitinophaga horti]
MNFRIRQCNKLQHLYQLRDPQQRELYHADLIPNAQAYLPPVPFGKLLIQRVSLVNLVYWHFNLTVEQITQFEFYPDVPSTSFHYMLENNMQLVLDGQTNHFREGEASLLYLRNINYEITLEPGRYQFVQVDPSWIVWQKLFENYPGIRKEVEVAGQTMGTFLNVGPCLIDEAEKKLLKHISTEPITRGRSALQQTSISLVRLFLDKCSISANQHS